jgi:O-antigen ligase
MAIILSHSRAGFASALLGMVVICILWGLSRSGSPKFALLFGVIAIAGAGAFFMFGGADLDQRLGNLLFERHERMQVYELTVGAIRDHPIAGTGYGTFASVFPSLRTPDIQNFYLLGHNTYLENALELGLPAAAGLFAVIVGLFVIALRGLRARRQSSIFPTIGAAVTILVAFHALFDFSIQIPAVALTYSFLMGIACAGSSRRKHAED